MTPESEKMVEYVGNAENINSEMNLQEIKSECDDILPSARYVETPTIESIEKRQTMNEIGDTEYRKGI